MRTTRIVELDLAKPQPATRGLYTTSIAFAATIWRVMRNRWASNRLHELDDRQLDDIGLSRHDVFARRMAPASSTIPPPFWPSLRAAVRSSGSSGFGGSEFSPQGDSQ